VATQNPIVKCGSCGGIYRRRLPDGSEYFHACPPLSAWELKQAIANKSVALSAEDQARIDAAAKFDVEAPVKAGETSNVDRALATIIVERPNKRDENVLGAGAPGQPAPIKSAGAGVTPV
jgi:hypothetical protein